MKKRGGISRAERVGQQIHQVVARLLLSGVDDPRLGEIEITGVELSPDLRSGKIYFVMLNGGEPEPEVLEGVRRVTGFVRTHLGSELRLRYVPELEFKFDEAVLRGRRIDDILSNLRED